MKTVVKVLLGTSAAVIILVGLLVVVIIALVLSIPTQRPDTTRSGDAREKPVAAQVASGPTTSAPEARRVATFRDGVRVIGSEVQPGTYRTRSRSPGCYWARLAGFSGELADLIANGTETPAVITIGAGDKGFESRRCGTWTADLSAITDSLTGTFSDGIYIVGTDISPGTWRANNPESCYWARLRGFSGAMGDLIANNSGSGIVTIAASDRGFSSQRCGTWTMVR